MKNTWLLAVLFLVLGGGAWYALRSKSAQNNTLTSPDMEFAVKNTGDIGKIFLADRKGRTATLELKDGVWMYNGTWPARATAVETLLETIQRVNVQHVPTTSAKEHMIKSLAAEGIKTEIYDKKGQLMKCYYVGGVTNDEKGTYMIMDKSEQPYIVHIPSFVGQLRVRYFLGDDLWRDRSVFKEKPEAIKSVTVEYPQRKNESFRLEKIKEGEYKVNPYFSTTQPNPSPQRKGFPESYLLQFEQLSAESYETNMPQRDSIAALVPFAIMTLQRDNGETKQVRYWPVEIKRNPYDQQLYIERYFAEVDQRDFMLVQDRNFGVVFKPYNFFFENAKHKLKQ
ncbi:MAG TPA: hypothetical protein PK971_07840 [Saprospiraceae bacterium]|nr:hypothetical protein [Saprospiraceae bacterium]HND88223.1 hypothetical protein [Saprospiraceae bacterium]